MTETPDETKRAPRGAYLPVLPDGWTYSVLLEGPGADSVKIGEPTTLGDETGPKETRYPVTVETDGEGSEVYAPSLGEAAKKAADIAKGLAKVRDAENKAQESRAALLDALGGSEDTPEQETGVRSSSHGAPMGENVAGLSRDEITRSPGGDR